MKWGFIEKQSQSTLERFGSAEPSSGLWGVLLVMLSVDGCIKSVKIYKNLEKLYNKKSWLFMTKKIGLLINELTFLVVQLFQIFIYFYTFYTSIYT